MTPDPVFTQVGTPSPFMTDDRAGSGGGGEGSTTVYQQRAPHQQHTKMSQERREVT